MTTYQMRNLRHRVRGWKQELLALMGVGVLARLEATVIRADGTVDDLGILSRRKVTTAAAAFIVDAFQNLTELETMNYHASGTGTGAEANTDTTLGAETGSRVAGTQSEPASTQYRTVATISYSGTLAITEHGIFSASSAGTLLDRSVFAAINVGDSDQITFTYTLSVNSEA